MFNDLTNSTFLGFYSFQVCVYCSFSYCFFFALAHAHLLFPGLPFFFISSFPVLFYFFLFSFYFLHSISINVSLSFFKVFFLSSYCIFFSLTITILVQLLYPHYYSKTLCYLLIVLVPSIFLILFFFLFYHRSLSLPIALSLSLSFTCFIPRLLPSSACVVFF